MIPQLHKPLRFERLPQINLLAIRNIPRSLRFEPLFEPRCAFLLSVVAEEEEWDRTPFAGITEGSLGVVGVGVVEDLDGFVRSDYSCLRKLRAYFVDLCLEEFGFGVRDELLGGDLWEPLLGMGADEGVFVRDGNVYFDFFPC